jgi:hypothetical protein
VLLPLTAASLPLVVSVTKKVTSSGERIRLGFEDLLRIEVDWFF